MLRYTVTHNIWFHFIYPFECNLLHTISRPPSGSWQWKGTKLRLVLCLYRTKLKLNGEYNIRIRRECPDDQNNEIRKIFFLNLLCITYHFLFLKKKHTKLLLLLNHLQSTYCQWYNNMSWWGFNWVHSDDLADLMWNRGVLKICKQMGVQIEDDS